MKTTALSETHLQSGKYEVEITDANGCKIELPAIFIEEPPPILFDLISITNPTCYNNDDGKIILEAYGGNGQINILWNGVIIDPDTVQWPAGVIQLEFEDEKGCTTTERFELNNPPELSIEWISIINPTCGQEDGYISAMGNGGTGNIKYNWSNGQSISEINDLIYGLYTLTIEDDNGCTAKRTVELIGGDSLLIEVETTAAGCEESASGSFSLRVINPVGIDYVLWINEDLQNELYRTGSSIHSLNPGSYNIVLESETGCSGEITFEIGIDQLAELQIEESFTIQKGMSVFLSPQLEGVDPDEVLFSWSPSNGLSCSNCKDPQATPSVSTVYTVTAVLPDGCIIRANTEVIVETDQVLYIPTAFSPNNDGNNDFFTVYVTEEVALIHGMWIYDRWGSLIFHVQNCEPIDFSSSCRWDGRYKGRELPSQNFMAVISIETISGEKSVFSSDFMLIR
jgi:gliding motility-associated-like protein